MVNYSNIGPSWVQYIPRWLKKLNSEPMLGADTLEQQTHLLKVPWLSGYLQPTEVGNFLFSSIYVIHVIFCEV